MNLKGAAAEKFGPIRTFFYGIWAEPLIEPMHRRIASEVPLDAGGVLDVGCGGGKLVRLIARARPGARVVGIDSSEPMIRAARRGPNPPNVEFRVGTVEGSGYTEEFDLALTVLSFHHWEQPLETLGAVHRALAPGGRLWIYEMDPEAPADGIRADRAALWGFLRMPIRLQRAMSREHGFTLDEVDSVVRPAVEKTPFRSLTVARAASTLRLELERAPHPDPLPASGETGKTP